MPGNGRLAHAFMYLETVFLVAVIACGSFTVTRSLIRMHSTFQMNYAEGAILNSALRRSHGGTLYQPIRSLHYPIAPYPPFIYKFVSVVIVEWGVGLFYPRLLALAAALLACLFATLLIRHCTGRWRLAVAFGLLPLTVAPLQAWLGILRYDFIGIALTMIGLSVFVQFPKFRFWSLPFFILAVAGLYTLVAAPAACCLWLWAQGNRKKSLLFGAFFAGALVAGFLYGQHASAGAMAYHLFKTQHSPYSVSQLASFSQEFLRGYGLLAALSAVVVWKCIREIKVSLAVLYWLLVAGTSLSMGKV